MSKKQIKKIIEKNKSKTPKKQNETKTLITILVSIILFVGLVYIVSAYAKGELGIKKGNETSTTVDTKTIIAGKTFKQNESKYYVLFYEFHDEDYNSLNTLYDNYKDIKIIYKVDLNDGINGTVISDTPNKEAQTADQLRINDATLIEIEFGQNVNYITGVEEITKYLETN